MDVRAENSGGNSAYSGDFATATTPLAPGPPGTPTLTSRTATSLTLASTAPTTGGTPSTYRWRYSTDSAVTDSDPEVTSSDPTVTLADLTADTPYWVDVRAENSGGNSAYSAAFATATTLPAAAAPTVTIGAVTSVDEDATQTLTATVSGGTYDALSYAWTVDSGGGTLSGSGASVTYTPANVSADTTVTVRVTVTATGTGTNASNGSSDTDSDTESFTVTAATTVTANAGADVTIDDDADADTYVLQGSVSVVNPSGDTTYAWTFVGGATQNGYTASLDDATLLQPTLTLPNLPNSTTRAWTLRLTVTNNGVSHTDDVVVTLRDYTPPPLSVTISGPTQLNFGQTATYVSTVIGGSGAISYRWQLQVWGGAGLHWAILTEETNSSLVKTTSGAGTNSYRLTVTRGSETATSNVITTVWSAAPGTPASFTATAGNAQVTLGWTAAAANGATITKYQYRQKAGTGAYGSWTDIASSASATSHTVTGLTNGTTYTFQLRAVNGVGNGTAATSSSVTPGVPGVPTSVSAHYEPDYGSETGMEDSISVTFSAPSSGGAATSYRAEYLPQFGLWTLLGTSTIPGTITIANPGPGAGGVTSVRVRASNAHGSSAWVTVTPSSG